MNLTDRPGKVILLFLILAVVRGLLYSAIILPWQAPDEPRHFEYVKLLYEKQRLVSWADVDPAVEKEIIASMAEYDFWNYGLSDWSPTTREAPLPQRFGEIWTYPGTQHELHQPPLSYLLYLAPLRLVSDEDIAVQLYSMRLVSIVLSALVVLVGYLAGRELFPNDYRLSVAVPVFILFLPMHTFMTSTVNNDHLAELLVSLLMFVWVRGFRRGLSYYHGMVMAILIASGMLAKRTAIVTIPICIAAALLYLWGRNIRTLLSWRWVFRGVAGLVVAAGVLAFLLLTWSRMAVSNPRQFLVESYFFIPSDRWPFSFRQPYLSSDALAAYRSYAVLLFESFWGRFGWNNVPIGATWYTMLVVVSLGALLGLGLLAVRGRTSEKLLSEWQTKFLLLSVLSVLFAVAIVVVREIRTNWETAIVGWPNGRYLYPVIIPVATLFAVGTRELFPRRLRDHWWYSYVGGLIFLDMLSLIRYIIPFFYG